MTHPPCTARRSLSELSGNRDSLNGMETPGSGPTEAAAADATPAPDAPVWRFLISPRWLAWHLTVVLAFWGMLWMGDWQLHRALAGNGLSWAYTFEWPLFAGFAIVFWVKTVRDEFKLRRGGGIAVSDTGPEPELPEGVGVQHADAAGEDPEDAELAAYNARLARLNAEVKGHGKWHGLR